MDKLLNSTYDNTSIFSLEGKTLSAKCVDIYDGDTLTLTVSIAGNIYKFKMRLSGIDTPEIRPKKIIQIEMKKKMQLYMLEIEYYN